MENSGALKLNGELRRVVALELGDLVVSLPLGLQLAYRDYEQNVVTANSITQE
jgi:hypothetical protein